MGASHARAYHKMPEFEIVGVVSRGAGSRHAISQELGGLAEFSDYYEALKATKPDVVSINTYPETHAAYAKAAIQAGCHVFCEKPLAETVAEAQSIVDAARAGRRKLVIGYILRVHPAWIRFIELARTLGKPLVMRMNLNQQSHGPTWNVHRNLMKSMSPIVDCGVHYVDVMCQMTGAKPVRCLRLRSAFDRGIETGDVQLRTAPGHVRRRVSRLVRSGLGPDDERGGILRQRRDRARRLRIDREGQRRGKGVRFGQHRQSHQDQPHSSASKRDRREQRVPGARRNDQTPRTSPIIRDSAIENRRSSCERSVRTSICRIICRTPSTACGSSWPPTRACGRAKS